MVRGIKQRLLGLCLPPLVLCLLDTTITLFGQSARYWAGNYANVNEASPALNHLLQIHPAAFALGIAAWAVVFIGVILLLPDTLALIVSLAVTFGHTAGTASWLVWKFRYGYQLCNGLFLFAAILLGVGIRWGWRAGPREEYQFLARYPLVRWGLAALLCAVGVCLFLWPRSP